MPTATTSVSRLARAAAVTLLAALGMSGLSAGAAVAASDNVSWAVRTASNDFGAERTSFSYAIDPGGNAADGLVVVNHGTEDLTLSVYASDGYTTDSGQFDILKKDAPSVGVGAWIRPEQDTVTVAPGGTTTVPFTVNIPTSATPGDYAGGIVTSLVAQDQSQGINVDRRLGIRVNLRVGGTLTPTLAVENVHVDYSGTFNPFAKGDATVTYTLHNTGNAILSGTPSASVAGPFGWLRADSGTVDPPPQLLPGESWKITVPVHGVAPLFRVTATASLIPLMTDPSGSTSSLDTVTATAGTWAVPWTAAVVVLLVVAAVVLLLLQARRRRARRKKQEDLRVQQAVEQALRDRGETPDGEPAPAALEVGATPSERGGDAAR